MSGPQKKCRNGHPISSDPGGPPVTCPTCGAGLESAHPFLLGALAGLGSCVLVSVIEMKLIQYSLSFPPGLFILWGSIPLVFVISGAVGAAHLKVRFGNTRDLRKLIRGTLSVFSVFLILWVLFLLLVLASAPSVNY